MIDRPLAGRRVLVVEDEYLIVKMLDGVLRNVGAVVIGPAPSVRAALGLLEREIPDVALVDVNLDGEMADPVIDALVARRIPVLLTTGYDARALPSRFSSIRVLEKPAKMRTVVLALEALLCDRDPPAD